MEVMAIANDVGTINLSLFKKTPLNNSSSDIGEMIIVDITAPIGANELTAINGTHEDKTNALNPGI